MRADDGCGFKALATDSPVFELIGGIYQITAVDFTTGSASLCQLGPNGTTWLAVAPAFTEDGGDTVYLPRGQFKWVISGEPAVSVGAYRVAGD